MVCMSYFLRFLMVRLPPSSTHCATRFPYPTLFRSGTRSNTARYLRLTDMACKTASTPLSTPPRQMVGTVTLSRIARALRGEDSGHEKSETARPARLLIRSEEHTSELQSLLRNSYSSLCLTTKHKYRTTPQTTT